MKTIHSLLCLSAALLGVNSSVGAQSAPSSSVTTNNASGVMAYSLYGGARENINLGTGNLNIQIPLLSLPGRAGLDLSVGLTYDSKNWNLSYYFDEYFNWYEWYAEERPNAVGVLGWRLNIPYISATERCTNGQTKYVYDTDFIVTLPDGSRHHFKNKDNTFRRPNGCDDAYQQIAYPSMDVPIADSSDGSYMRLDTSPSDHVILHMKDGTRIYFYGTSFTYGGSPSPVKVVDPNGNFITYNNPGLISSITDSLGRTVTFTYVPGTGTLSQITYKDSSGTSRNITFAYQTPNISPTFSQPAGAVIAPVIGNMLSTITLPNNRMYSFTHNNFGELTKIIYPTGGYTGYDYGAYSARHQLYIQSTGGDFRQITAKKVCPKETSTCTTGEEQVTAYTPTIQGTYSNNSSTQVLDPSGNKTTHTFTYAVNAPDLGPNGTAVAGPRELTRQVYEGTTTLLRTLQTDYTGTGDLQLPIRVTTTLETSQVSKVEWDYGTYTNSSGTQATIDNVIEQRDYDHGNVAKRKTKSTYLKVNPVNGYNYDSTAIFILNRKTKQEVYDWNGSTETLKAKTEWEYDSYTEGLTASGTVQHDSAYGTSYTKRGNVTATSVWRDNPAATLITRNQYDDAGNLRKTTDPLNHATTFSYTDSWANTTCQPVGGSAKAYLTSVTNALNHVTTSTYNSCSGTIASTTDPNSQTTTFSYDLMNRLVQTNLPGGGQTTRTYSEGAVPLSLTTTTKITASMNLVASVTVDGLGREVLSSLDSDPEGVTRTKTVYDALGRKQRTYNPTRCNPVETNCGESTWGYTEYVYDGLGRVTKVRPPDGTLNPDSNIVTTSYSGNTVTVTDQAGKKRKSETDALGRLIRVWEPDAAQSLVHVTRYQYDVLDNLLCVHQKSTDATPDKACGDATVPAAWRERRYTYNSLSQLLTTYNPESGSITFAYDNDGNLTAKSDARSITTTHAYDVLHRLTGKTYSNGDPAISYFYDQTSYNGLTITNGKGRRTGMGDAAGAEAWTYGPLGQVLTDRRTSNSVTKDFAYQYNLDGSVWKITYPSGRIITYSYNAAARLTAAQDVANGINYATGASYTAGGALALLTNGASLVSTYYYNNRLQPCRISVKSSGTAPGNCTDGVNIGNVLDFTYSFDADPGAGVVNNGNVMSIANNRDTNRSQSFTYDELNRISTAKTQATTGSHCWGETFTYDIWANLLSIAGIAPAYNGCTQENLSVAATTSNRISGLSYDAAGNLTADGANTYQWDAESRMKSLNTTSVLYTYDGDGRRVKKSNGKLYWYGPGLDALLETDLAGNTPTEYVLIGGKRGARRDPSGSVFYYFANHLGSANVVTNSAGTIVEESDYYPFGGERAVVNNDPNPYKFTGKERDTESTLDYFGARYYSSNLGRFHSPDLPFIDQHLTDPQSWNLYAYARNNPLILTDPTGNAVDGPMGGTGLLPGVHHGGAVSLSMLSGVTSSSWFTELTVVGGEIILGTTTTSADVQEASQQQVERPAWANTWLGGKVYDFLDGDQIGVASQNAVDSESTAGKVGGALALGFIIGQEIVPVGKLAKGAKWVARGAKAGVRTWRSMSALRRALGPAGQGLEWHHIVEQCKACDFGPEAIHNTDNIVGLLDQVHRKISGYYSSKRGFTGGLTIRDWLKGQSFEAQREFGLRVLRDVLEGRLP